MREWLIKIEEVVEGPFTIQEMKRDERLTPDTLVWKKGLPDWLPIRDVPELQELFGEEEQHEREEEEGEAPPALPQEELVLEFPYLPPYFLLWLLIALVAMIYFLWNFYG